MGRELPSGMSGDVAAVWYEVESDLRASAPNSIVEAYVGQVMTVRQARAAVASDGGIVRDGKANAVEHPAFTTERASIRLIGELLKEWKAKDAITIED